MNTIKNKSGIIEIFFSKVLGIEKKYSALDSRSVEKSLSDETVSKMIVAIKDFDCERCLGQVKCQDCSFQSLRPLNSDFCPFIHPACSNWQ